MAGLSSIWGQGGGYWSGGGAPGSSTFGPQTGAFGVQARANPFALREAALAKLQSQLSGPFDDAAQQSIINKGAGMAATAEAQQQEALRQSAAERGLSASDPSVQAEQRRLTSQRQGAVMDIAGDTRRAATQANYDGGYRAATALLRADPYGGAFGMSTKRSQPGTQAYGGIDFKPLPKNQPSFPIFGKN